MPLARLWQRGGYPDGGVLGGDGSPVATRLPRLARPARSAGLGPAGQTAGNAAAAEDARGGPSGQAWNGTQVGQSLGLSYHTVNGYLDYLEGAFLVRRLRPSTPTSANGW